MESRVEAKRWTHCGGGRGRVKLSDLIGTTVEDEPTAFQGGGERGRGRENKRKSLRRKGAAGVAV